MRLAIPENRLRTSNSHPLKTDGQWVLYWMTAFRRTRYNFALQHAAHLAQEMGKPLVILEALRVRYRWACDRFHRFIIEGMVDNQQACSRHAVHYFPYVEPQAGDGSGLVETLARDACAVVTDDFPCFFHPAMISRLSKQVSVRVDAVDSNAIMPLAHAERTFTVAHSYRRWMQKELPFFLEDMPMESPLASAELANLPDCCC